MNDCPKDLDKSLLFFPPCACLPSPGQTRRSRWLFGLSLLWPASFLVLVTGCEHAPPERPKKPVEVVVTTPIRDEVADYQDFTGRLDGYRTVDIRARASGYITEAPFKEGDAVRKNDLLFQIDPRPYQAALNQAEANRKLAEADWNVQKKNAERARRLVKTTAISQEDYDTVLATEEKALANVGAMEAARDMAKLNLEFTHVIAPLDGRISRRYVDPGNLILADNTILTTLVTDRQLYAYFDVDERTYLDLMQSRGLNPATSGGPNSWLKALQFPVLMCLANEGNKFQHIGLVDFIDNRVVSTSGTIRMRGIFDNPDGILKAGLFIRIRLPIGKPYKTLLIAAEAIQSDQGRSYVYVVDEKNVVNYRRVTVGQQELEGLRAIKEGLAEGDRVIVSGMQRVRSGAQVEIKLRPPPKAPEAPLVRLLSGRLGLASGG